MRPGSLLRCSPLSGAKILKLDNDSKQAFCAKWILALKCGTNMFCCVFKNIFLCLEEIILIKIINFSLFQKWHKKGHPAHIFAYNQFQIFVWENFYKMTGKWRFHGGKRVKCRRKSKFRGLRHNRISQETHKKSPICTENVSILRSFPILEPFKILEHRGLLATVELWKIS